MCQAFESNGAKLGQHEQKMQLAPLASVLRPLAHATRGRSNSSHRSTDPSKRLYWPSSIIHGAPNNQRPKESRSESVNVRVWHSPRRNRSAAATHAASTGDRGDHAADA